MLVSGKGNVGGSAVPLSSTLNDPSLSGGAFAQRQGGPTEYPAMAPTRPDKPSASLFRQTYQSGFLSVLYAIGQRPLDLWEKQIRSGYVKRVNDPDIRSLTVEIVSPNVGTTFITTPPNSAQSLGVHLPIIVLILKNLKRYFMFDVQVLDDTKNRRRFTVSNFTQAPKIRPFSATLPLRLDEGWNQVSLNLAELTQKLYGSQYKETVRLQIHPNCRLRRVYFCDRTYTEEEVPAQFKLFITNAATKGDDDGAQRFFDSKETIAQVIAASTNSPPDGNTPSATNNSPNGAEASSSVLSTTQAHKYFT